jgi:hypothetical protein
VNGLQAIALRGPNKLRRRDAIPERKAPPQDVCPEHEAGYEGWRQLSDMGHISEVIGGGSGEEPLRMNISA